MHFFLLQEELDRLLAEATRYETKMDIINMHCDVLRCVGAYHALFACTYVECVFSVRSASSFRHENEALAEKYTNAQASLNSTLSLKARSVHLLHIHRYTHMPMCVYISSSLILFVSNILPFILACVHT